MKLLGASCHFSSILTLLLSKQRGAGWMEISFLKSSARGSPGRTEVPEVKLGKLWSGDTNERDQQSKPGSNSSPLPFSCLTLADLRA